MKTIFSIFFVALFSLNIFAQTEAPVPEFNLGFEKYAEGAPLPDKWQMWGTGYTAKVDKAEKKSGEVSVLVEPGAKLDENTFGAVAYPISANYAGKEIELRGSLKYQDVADGYAGLFLRVDGNGGVLQFDNMRDRGLTGSADWTQQSIKLPLPEGAATIYVGALLTGKGKMWVDDLQVFIDGKEIREAKMLPPPKATLDKEFDTGSKIEAATLNAAKIEDLAVLGKVWGFLKYHHPAVAGGDRNWDYELFRVMPKILAAKNKNERNEALSAWVNALGKYQKAQPMLEMKKQDLKLTSDLGWVEDKKALGEKLSAQLHDISYAQRSDKNYYIAMAVPVGNPQFKNESSYRAMSYPDAGFRMLALYRYWSIIQYFYPNRHLTGEDWNKVMSEFVPQFMNAADGLAYKKAALALIARIHDTHANIWGRDATLDKFRGVNTAAARVTFVEDRAVVTGFWDQALGEKTGLKTGDVIESIDGVKVADMVKQRLPFTPASNYPTQLRDIAVKLLNTNEAFLGVSYKRDGRAAEAKLETYAPDKMKVDPNREMFQRNVPAFKMIGSDVAYLYPGSLKPGEIQSLLSQIAKTKGLIVDLRCYPTDFIVFSLGEFLMPKATPFVKFTGGSVTDPGSFIYREGAQVGKDNPDAYKGKVVILVNEISQSQAEYTTLALRVAPGAVVIGGTTAGADGNISTFALPGNINTAISGIGVYYPDGRETQRVGIVPDIVLKPTIKGVKEGKDELLDKALDVINGVAQKP
jgi:C-terminal processing protease CtpA/Prc